MSWCPKLSLHVIVLQSSLTVQPSARSLSDKPSQLPFIVVTPVSCGENYMVLVRGPVSMLGWDPVWWGTNLPKGYLWRKYEPFEKTEVVRTFSIVTDSGSWSATSTEIILEALSRSPLTLDSSFVLLARQTRTCWIWSSATMFWWTQKRGYANWSGSDRCGFELRVGGITIEYRATLHKALV